MHLAVFLAVLLLAVSAKPQKSSDFFANARPVEFDMGDGFTSSKLSFVNESNGHLTKMVYDIERFQNLFDPSASEAVEAVTCSGSVVHVQFASEEALKQVQAKYFSSKAYMVLRSSYGCSGLYHKVLSAQVHNTKHTASSPVLAIVTERVDIAEVFRKLVLHFQSNHAEVIYENAIITPQGLPEIDGDVPNFNGAVWSDTFSESYTSPDGYSVIFQFDPTLYIDVDISYTFGVPTSVNDLNITLAGYLGANLTLSYLFDGLVTSSPFQFFSVDIPISAVSGLPIDISITATAQLDGVLQNPTQIFATVQAGGTASLGVYYDNGFGAVNYADFTESYYIQPVNPTGSVSLALVLTPTVDVNLVEGFFQVGVVPPFTLLASTDENNCIGYQVSFNATATAKVGISILSDSWSETIINNEVIWTQPCQN